LILLIAGTAAALGPVLGFACAAAGSLASAIVTYYIGVWLGGKNLERALGPRLHRIRERVQRSGVLAVTAIRLVPIAPFTIVNMVAGASGISFSHYIIGTAFGLLPGLVMLSAVGSQIVDIIRRRVVCCLLLPASLFGLSSFWALKRLWCGSAVASREHGRRPHGSGDDLEHTWRHRARWFARSGAHAGGDPAR
jgi:uncharacterized membrane protein YdjX (TVP38/TMEM64 family)